MEVKKNIFEKKQLRHQGNIIEYLLKKGNQKNLIIKLDGQNIVVSAPFFSPDWEIEKFLYQNIKKIEKIIFIRDKFKVYQLSGKNKFIKIFNDKVPFIFDNEIDDNVKFKGLVFKKYDSEKETLLKIYNKLKNDYINVFKNTLNKYSNIIGVEYKNYNVRYFKTKWGICYPNERKILLNIRLIHYDLKALEYVCVHELSHLIHHNHSKDFWHLVQKFLPCYREYANILKFKD